jgi:hypothetical protein
LENLGVDIIGLTIKDLVDIYFEEWYYYYNGTRKNT